MVRVYRYRLYPSRAQHVVMLGILWLLRELYNAALQHRSVWSHRPYWTLGTIRSFWSIRPNRWNWGYGR